MSPFLVDTDILVDASRGVAEAIEFLKQSEAQGTLSISVITRMELLAGCRDKREQREVEQFLKRFTVVPLNEVSSQLAVEVLTRYRLSHACKSPMRSLRPPQWLPATRWPRRTKSTSVRSPTSSSCRTRSRLSTGSPRAGINGALRSSLTQAKEPLASAQRVCFGQTWVF